MKELDQYADFVEDLSSYLKSEDPEDWDALTQNYSFELQDDGRYLFFPNVSHDTLDERIYGQVLVQKPSNADEIDPIGRVSGDIYDGIGKYLKETDAVEKLTILAGLEDRFEHTWLSDGKVRFGPTEDNGVVLGVPSLAEIADSYNGRSEEDVIEADEQEFLSEIASKTSSQLGNFTSTVYINNGRFFVEEDSEEGTRFYEIDAVGEVVSVEEAFNIYRMIRDDENQSSFEQEEVFDTIDEAFLSAELDDVRMWVDPENDQVLTFDTDTIDAEVNDLSEVQEWYEEDILEMAADFYERLSHATLVDGP